MSLGRGNKRGSYCDDVERFLRKRDAEVYAVVPKQEQRSHVERAPGRWDEDNKATSKKVRLEECRMAMETMRACLQSSYDLAEIYSPPRVVKEAVVLGMRGGFSCDFTIPEPNGYIWNFDPHECRQRAFRMIREKRLYVIIGSPECTIFATSRSSK